MKLYEARETEQFAAMNKGSFRIVKRESQQVGADEYIRAAETLLANQDGLALELPELPVWFSDVTTSLKIRRLNIEQERLRDYGSSFVHEVRSSLHPKCH